MRKLLLPFLIIAIHSSVNAQSGTPDPSFGNHGAIVNSIPGGNNKNSQIIRQCILRTDGRMLMVVQSGSKTVINRRLSNGNPDMTYGSNGFSVVVSMSVTSAAAQADGKIVVAGTTDGTNDFMLARYDTDGLLDPTFGSAGIVIFNVGSPIDFLNAMVITPAGNIIAGGSTRVNATDRFAIVHFTPNGAPDNSFGTNGIVLTEFDGLSASIASLYLQPDGKLLAAGTAGTASGVDFALARYNADGSPDLGFNLIGRTSSDFSATDRATSVIADKAGKIYVGGVSGDLWGPRHFRIARYNADGSIDNSYNSGAGSLSPNAGVSDDVLTNIRLRNDGSIIAAGTTNINPAGYDVAVMHITVDGTVDSSFGNNGLALGDYNANYDESDFLVIQPDGKILTGGTSSIFTPSYNSWFSGFRFNEDGTPDAGFSNGGTMADFMPILYYAYNAMFVQADGKLVAAAESDDAGYYKMYMDRFNSDGTPDSTYGQNGRRQLHYDYGTSYFQPDGKMIRSSYSETNNGDIMLVRYNADGLPDNSFGVGGRVISDFGGSESGGPLAFQADGKIIVGGFSRDANGTDWLIVRYNADGTIDNSFGTNGVVRKDNMTEENIQSIKIAPNGKIVLGGTGYTYPPDFSSVNFNILLARLNADGSFDSGFGNSGALIIDRAAYEYFNDLVVQDDGKVVFGYSVSDGINPTTSFLEQLNIDGTFNGDFGQGGKTITNGGVLTLEADQKILVPGTFYNGKNNTDFILTRFTRDGKPDLSFGTNGKTISSFTGVDNFLYNGLISGDAVFYSGSGMNIWGKTVGVVAKFRLASVNFNCPVNQEIVTDRHSCSARVYNIDPSIECCSGPPITYELTGATTGKGTCSASGQLFNKGVTTVGYRLGTDTTKFCSFTVTVSDKEIPQIVNLTTSVSTLLDPDHQMRAVTVDYVASDNCELKSTELSVTSNEPVVAGAGDLSPDWEIINAHQINLRAESLENGTGRIYTVQVTTTDVSGNTNSKTALVTVPAMGAAGNLNVKIAPNPTHNYFLVTPESNSSQPINVRVFTCEGTLMIKIDGLHTGESIKIGENFLPGVYHLEVSQSSAVKRLKLIKL